MRPTLLLLAFTLVACGDDDGTIDASMDSALEDAPPRDAATDEGAAADAGPATGSAGCGQVAGIAEGDWVNATLDAEGAERVFQVRLPEGYDRDRPYPVVYQFHGCSNNEERERNNVRVENVSGSDAIHVRGRAIERCWDTAADGTGVAMFDALVRYAEANFCADPERRFVTGYSSGAFMTHRLACVRGAEIRGVASIAGGQGGNGCSGTVAALLIHDRDDATVEISASERARDAHAERNACSAERSAIEPAPCEALQGCASDTPVVWCETSGENHSRQDAFAADAFWSFFASL